MFSIDTSEVDDLVADLLTVEARVAPPAHAATKAALDRTADTQRRLAPVRTGELRDSVGVDLDSDGMGGEVGPDAAHTPFVVYGTSTMAGNDFVGASVDADGYVRDLERAADGVLG